MKVFSKMLKSELKDLIVHRSLLVLLFFGILVLDALGAIFPRVLNSQVTLFLPLPIIFIYYVINTKNTNKLFLLSIALNFTGIMFFNNAYKTYDSLGLFFHTIAFFCYVFILFKYYCEINDLRSTLIYSIIVVCLVTVPLIIYAKGIERMQIFYDTLFYALSVTLFIIFTVLLYVANKTKAYRFLLFSSIAIFSSSCFQGYNLFVKSNGMYLFLAIIGLNLTHFFMSRFLLEKE